jgi:3-deoxy-D-manno-octulosonate 8-phosphate phosphatase (KDO 8-P phosphatase)
MDPGQTREAGSPQHTKQDGLRLIVAGVADRDAIRHAVPDQPREKLKAGAPRGLFQIPARGFQIGIGAIEFESQSRSHRRYGTLVTLGIFSAQLVIEVSNARERDTDFPQHVKQAHRIRATGDGDGHADARRQHAITRDSLEHSLDHGSFLHCSSGEFMNNDDLQQRASRIRLLLMDVDGVLTDAKLFNVPGPDGKMWETKGFDAQDGIALQWLNWYGIQTGVISGRVSPATEERARQVKMTYVYQGHIEKIPILEEISAKSGIPLAETAYIGDDLTDVVVMRRVALAIAPANARPEVKRAAHMITAAAGGSGAVREVIEMLLQAQGKWAEILKKYEAE